MRSTLEGEVGDIFLNGEACVMMSVVMCLLTFAPWKMKPTIPVPLQF